MNKAVRSYGLKLAIVSTAVTACLSLTGSSAFAFGGGGYGPPVPTPPVGPGGFSIVTTQTVPSSGGVVSGSAYSASITVVIPSGSLPQGGQVVITASRPCNLDAGLFINVIADFGVEIINPNTGQKLPGPFTPTITVTISDPSIIPTDRVVTILYPGQPVPVPTATVTTGQTVIPFAGQPNFAVVALGHSTLGNCPAHPVPHPPFTHRTRDRGQAGWFGTLMNKFFHLF